MFGFLRRKRPASGEASPAPADSASPGAESDDTASSGGIGVTAQSLYPAEILYPSEVLEPVPEPVPPGSPASPASRSPAHADRAAEPAPSGDVDRAADAPPAVEPAAPTGNAAAAGPAPAVEPTPRAERASRAEPAPQPEPASRAEPAPQAPAKPDAAPSARPAGGFGALYPSEILARPEALAASSAETVVVTLPEAERRTWVARLRDGMSRTRGNLAGIFSNVQVGDALFEELENALIASDAGVATTQWLMQRLQDRVRRDRLTDAEAVRRTLRALLVELLLPLEKPMDIDRAEPLVMMIAGVNGAGKTTSIGKLAHHLQREGKSILLAAGDTFRAAAREQLAEWGARNRVDVIAQQGGDPAAVAFDAVNAGRARRTGIVMIDTAGRLPTQVHLMDELKKIRRVVAKAMDAAPHETLLVLDGNTGQNMLAQVKAFDEAVPLTGLIVTKLDGTAKGGALAALAYTRRERPIAVYFIGVGEKIDDLQAFSAEEFAGALLD